MALILIHITGLIQVIGMPVKEMKIVFPQLLVILFLYRFPQPLSSCQDIAAIVRSLNHFLSIVVRFIVPCPFQFRSERIYPVLFLMEIIRYHEFNFRILSYFDYDRRA